MRRLAGDAAGLWKALEPWADLAEEIDLAGMYRAIDAGEMRATEGLRYRDTKSSPWWVYTQVHKLAHPLIMALMQERDLGVLGKSFERASRALVIRGSYAPRASLKWVDWYAKVADAIKVVKQALRLPEQEGGFLVGPLEVVNNSGKTGKDLEPLVRSIEEVVEALKGLPIPGIGRALYGRVILTGAIQRKTNLVAWYTLAEDQVWVKVTGKYGESFRQALAHELTHRWWRKFADKSIKEAWHKHHYSVAAGAKVEEIKIGDPIPVKLRGIKTDPVVVGEKPGVWLVTAPELEGLTAQVSKYDLYKVMHGNAQKLSYPTIYSASDPEEHFCDAVGLWSTGDLKEPHLSAIRGIVTGSNHTAGKVASRLIHVDQKQISRLLEGFRSWAANQGSVYGEDSVAGDSHMHTDVVAMNTPWGEAREILVAFMPGRGVGGAFGALDGAPLVKVFFDKQMMWRGLAKPVPALNSVLQHEVTHALDRLNAKAQGANAGDTTALHELGVSPKAYFNDPHEVRAYMRTIFEDVAPIVRMMAKGPALEKLGLDRILMSQVRNTEAWKLASRHWTDKNRKRVLKGLFTSFEDEMGSSK